MVILILRTLSSAVNFALVTNVVVVAAPRAKNRISGRHKRHRKKRFHITDINSTYKPLASWWLFPHCLSVFTTLERAETTLSIHPFGVWHQTVSICIFRFVFLFVSQEYYYYYQHHKYESVSTVQKLIFFIFCFGFFPFSMPLYSFLFWSDC